MMRARIYYPVLAGILLVVGLHLVLQAAGVTYYMTQLTMSAYYGLVVIGLCLLMGYAGQLSLGHAGFFAIGGYTSAVLTTCNLSDHAGNALIARLHGIGVLVQWQDIYGQEVLSFCPWVAFGAAIYRIVLGTRVFGQADGLSNVPPFSLVGPLQVNGRAPWRIQNYYIAWITVLAAMVLALNLIHSRVGRALRSIHENEEAAHSLGINTYRYKLATFVLSALFAAVGGVLMTHYNGSIGPSEAAVMKSVRYVAVVAVGGMANLWGVLLMGVLLNFLSLRGVFGTFDDAVFGTILIGVMLFAPGGLLRMPRLQAISSLLRRRSHG